MQARIRVKTTDILRIAVDAHLHPNTVIAVIAGRGNPRENTRAQVVDAAKRLGVSLPELPARPQAT